MPALKTVLRPEVPSWKRPVDRRPWLTEEGDPAELAREAVAELRAAVEGLQAMRGLLNSYKQPALSRSGEDAARSPGRAEDPEA